MQRRKLLGLLGGSLTVSVAGCLGGDDGDDNGDDGGSDDSDEGSVVAGSEEFRGESRSGGFVWFGERDGEEARDDGLALPPSDTIENPVVVDAELNDDNTWQSTNIDFPNLVLAGLEDVDPVVTVPDGLSGEFSEEDELLTVQGEVAATVTVDGEDRSLTFPLNATTETSGDLEGSFEIEDDAIVTTIVDNESVVTDTFGGSASAVDSALNLPGPTQGDNWFELPLDIEPVE